MCQISPELVGGLESCLHGYNIGACFGDLAFKVTEELIKLNLNQIELVCKIYVGGGAFILFSLKTLCKNVSTNQSPSSPIVEKLSIFKIQTFKISR